MHVESFSTDNVSSELTLLSHRCSTNFHFSSKFKRHRLRAHGAGESIRTGSSGPNLRRITVIPSGGREMI